MGTEGYSPRLVAKIEYAGGNAGSFRQASEALGKLAEFPISVKHVQRITERLGQERGAKRDAEVEALKVGGLEPTHAEPPAVVAIHLDAGKVQLREENEGAGIHEPRWGDTKVGCFLTYGPKEGTHDPQADPPRAFLNRPRVIRLCREMERVRNQPWSGPPKEEESVKDGEGQDAPEVDRPKRLVRTVVATMGSTEPFGWLVAAEATKRGFYQALKKAVLGDGGNWIGPLADLHFPEWTQVLDFLHLLVHLYGGATAAYRGSAQQAWRVYERWLRWAWAGDVAKVLAGLREQSERLGRPPARAAEDDPRRVLALAVAYVETNAHRMDYARYRREGLPITSAPVESVIKQINHRVKGTEKFWVEGGAEAVLQVRSAYLSEDDRAEGFYDSRPRGRAVGRNRRRLAA